ncbi:hypothetical protein HK405_015689 [Cladochytrium tenue]|nr:hypothetical protein HK405_015689 [Cladochytrium tenue]
MPVQLYFAPTSASAASFLAAHAAGLITNGVVIANTVDVKTHIISSGPLAGKDYYTVNSKGNAPALVFEDGSLLNENTAVLLWISDHRETHAAPPLPPAPPTGSSDHYILVSTLALVASELHARINPFFSKPAPPADLATVDYLRNRFLTRLRFLDTSALADGRHFLVGDNLTVADIYCATLLSRARLVIPASDFEQFSNATTYLNSISAHPALKDAYSALSTLAQ